MRTVIGRACGVMTVVFLVAAGCAPPPPGSGGGGVTVQMDASMSDGFFSLPWPNEIRHKSDGTLDLAGIPTGDNLVLSLLAGAASDAVTDFGRNSAVYLRLSGSIDVSSLPSPSMSALPSSPVMLINLSDPGERIPVVVRVEAGDRYRPSNLLSMLPYPGHTLKPATDYAAVITAGVRAADGTPLVASPLVTELDQPWWFGRGRSEADWVELRSQRDRVRSALSATTSWSASDLVGFTVYRTQDSQREMRAIAATIAGLDIAVPPLVLDRSCDGSTRPAVLRGQLPLPMFQFGSFPYTSSGGNLSIGADGRAAVAGTRTIEVGIGVPCGAAPVNGWPIQTYIGGTGGSVDPDGGFTSASNVTVVGSVGPLYSYEGPGWTYDRTLFYNVLNPMAARSNPLQQAANNLVLLRVLERLSVDGSLVGTTGTVSTDDAVEIVTGHSQGAQTLALVASAKPEVDAVVSSAAVSGMYNSISYRSDIRTQFSLIIGDSSGLDIRNPLVQMIETLMDASEPANHPTIGHWLNFAGKRDGCVPFEASRNLAASQRLAVVNPQWGTILGDAALDPQVLTTPVASNVDGTTRVSVEADGVHQVAKGNPAIVSSFLSAVVTGVAPSVAGPVFAGPADSCDPRFGEIGNDD